MADVVSVLFAAAIVAALGARAAARRRNRSGGRATRARGLVLLGAIAGLAGVGLLASQAVADEAPIVSWASSSSYFSPNADGQSDAITLSYGANASGTVTVTVRNSDGVTVRVLQQDLPIGAWSWPTVTWDGAADDGMTVPDGIYQVVVVLTTAAGGGPEAALQVGVDTRIPGRLTAPSVGATVSYAESVAWRFEVTDGFPVAWVTIECSGGFGRGQGLLQELNVVSGTLDVSRCTTGDNALVVRVSWADGFDVLQSWDSPRLPIVVMNPPLASWSGASARSFSPNGDGQEDQVALEYTAWQGGTYTTVLRDARVSWSPRWSRPPVMARVIPYRCPGTGETTPARPFPTASTPLTPVA